MIDSASSSAFRQLLVCGCRSLDHLLVIFGLRLFQNQTLIDSEVDLKPCDINPARGIDAQPGVHLISHSKKLALTL